MFAHKEISHKVRGPTRSENARHLLMWVYRERCVHILYAFLACYTQCLCSFCTAKASLRPPLHHATCSLVKTSRIRQSQSRDGDLTAICDRTKKETKPEFQLRRLFWKARVKTEYQKCCLWFWEVKSANICSSF